MKRKFAAALLLAAVSLLAIEGALAWLDPLGIWRYYNDLRGVRMRFKSDDERIYVAAPGTYQMSNWEYTIEDGGTRHIPANDPNAGNTIVVLGDSVAFGLGVDDSETWPNLIAEATGYQVINTALPGYDLWAVRAAHDAFPDADQFIYLLIENDAAHDAVQHINPPTGTSAIRVYLYLFQTGRVDVHEATIPEDFWAEYDALVADPRVMVYGFRDGGLAEQVAASGRAITLIEPYTGRLSWADAHPDAEGHRQIAEQVLNLLPPMPLDWAYD
jgi:hypothetical protein